MKKLALLFIGVAFLVFACSEDSVPVKPQDEFKQKISEQEARVSELSKDLEKAKETSTAKVELVKVLLDYYREFPKDEYSANCLSKVHMIYAGVNDTKMAVAYADTLIEKYPKFVDRSQIIESQIIAYEMYVMPRNVEMIKKYLTLWIEENKDSDKGKISEMKNHLENADTPLIERLGKN